MEFIPDGSDENALQRVVFIVQFASEFSEQVFETFNEASVKWRNDLPRRSVLNPLVFQPGTTGVECEQRKISELSYEAYMKDGTVEFGLRFEKSRILFLVGRYSNWAEIWPIAESHLNSAVSLVHEDNQVASYATEYSDLFRGHGKYEDFDAAKILRHDSRLIPKHVFNRMQNFHFHTGFFETIDQPVRHRVLTRINTDLRDNADNKTRDLSVVLFHSVMPHHEPWTEAETLPRQVLNKGLDNFKTLHELDKKMLSDILNDDMSRRIGLLR